MMMKKSSVFVSSPIARSIDNHLKNAIFPHQKTLILPLILALILQEPPLELAIAFPRQILQDVQDVVCSFPKLCSWLAISIFACLILYFKT
jgi:hypothetical protein